MQGVGQHGKQNLLIREFSNAEDPSQAFAWVRIKSDLRHPADQKYSPKRYRQREKKNYWN